MVFEVEIVVERVNKLGIVRNLREEGRGKNIIKCSSLKNGVPA